MDLLLFLVLLLVVFALAGGLAVHPLLFAVLILAVVLYLAAPGIRGRR